MQLSDGAAKRSNEIFRNLDEMEKQMIVALPYRVGLYVSKSDEEGGDEAHEQEIMTLNNILVEIAQDYCKSEIMQHILIETVANKERWSLWEDNLDNVLSECGRAVISLEGLVDQPSDLQSVKETLIDIGVAVAMAFRESIQTEYQPETMGDKVAGMLQGVLERFMPAKHVADDRLAHLNISPRERESLMKLSEALI